MKKLLITGASGFLGWNFCQIAQFHWQVYGTYHTHALSLPQIHLTALNLLDFSALECLFTDIQPDAIIHTAAQSSPNYCQTHPQETDAINIQAAVEIARFSAQRHIPCVFTSTDLVFDGTAAPYGEADLPSPINHYGQQKVNAEQAMRQEYPQVTICRMPLMFGAAPAHGSSFIQPFIRVLRSHQPLALFTDEWRTPVSATTAAQGLLLALNHPGELFHLGGKERISRYQFGQLMAESLHLPTKFIQPTRQQDVPMAARRPQDVSLDSSKAFSLGYNPPSLQTQLQALQGQV
ncbi:NAD(P)-dependent oxidoreductase [Roseofilum reptotaenium CS-1145]|uniref:NAD(P)-dependent oxidoreductase n=1 Tax=Roseofilum reptotaenium AO1-A TaxID=1925591 RepID=A0A1L9QTE9_9CYAN|nr:NAD(P)-dependent oxidoreductase [Roseofilum reptotaenium]MDB9519756.1 NAD(P)-dependent oxidoreductase [Roseofilum reptotaenium CS-1145]OJJ25919.1 NAD(P)-dependent oxidoreductase [Roseofilum reptotaenium AO1-A]